ncbi:MAG: DNA -binding domain-containing protein [Alphaproteobacteria bacterium]
MGVSMTVITFQDRPPESDHLTAYDESHLSLYIRLLDAAAEGADWREAVQILFALDPGRDPDRARIVYDSHLARARWMTTTGYRELLRPRVS